ncbi:hypothetical protein HanPI659440_Chr03g0101681 [Helianthus annuus]|nr:hypothetical protein HanPI659440_Chr03g0101681 [Helianthus annuus]
MAVYNMAVYILGDRARKRDGSEVTSPSTTTSFPTTSAVSLINQHRLYVQFWLLVTEVDRCVDLLGE